MLEHHFRIHTSFDGRTVIMLRGCLRILKHEISQDYSVRPSLLPRMGHGTAIAIASLIPIGNIASTFLLNRASISLDKEANTSNSTKDREWLKK
jgi:hypothetical protein